MSSSSNSSRNNRSHPNRQENDQRNLSKDDNDDSNENQVHIKYLLPGATTGSVIGKGGERIASLQKETNTKIKMSKSGVKSFRFIHWEKMRFFRIIFPEHKNVFVLLSDELRIFYQSMNLYQRK